MKRISWGLATVSGLVGSNTDALDALYVAMMQRKVNWVLDGADIRGFFDAIDHTCLLQFIQYRIADKRINLIQKWLTAGISDDGEWSSTTVGTPQGAVISPLLANVFLHYVLDLYFDHWRRHHASGDVVVVRYADDFVIGFQYRAEADRVPPCRERLEKFD